MTRRTGRAPRGQRVIGTVPRNHGANVTCLVAMTPSGMRAPCVFEGAVDSVHFVQWMREWLMPTLVPGTTVVLDNLRVHMHADVRTVVEAAGCHLVSLPATRQISIRSSRHSASSRPICVGSGRAASTPWWTPSVPGWSGSPGGTSPATIGIAALPCPIATTCNHHEIRSMARKRGGAGRAAGSDSAVPDRDGRRRGGRAPFPVVGGIGRESPRWPKGRASPGAPGPD